MAGGEDLERSGGWTEPGGNTNGERGTGNGRMGRGTYVPMGGGHMSPVGGVNCG